MIITAANKIMVVTISAGGDLETKVNAAEYRLQRALCRGECAGYRIENQAGEILASWLVGK